MRSRLQEGADRRENVPGSLPDADAHGVEEIGLGVHVAPYRGDPRDVELDGAGGPMRPPGPETEAWRLTTDTKA